MYLIYNILLVFKKNTTEFTEIVLCSIFKAMADINKFKNIQHIIILIFPLLF